MLNADRKQRIYIYLSIAALIGCFAGAILHLSFSYLTSTLGLDAVPGHRTSEKGPTVAEHRSTKRRARAGESGYPSIDAKPGVSRRKANVEEDKDSL